MKASQLYVGLVVVIMAFGFEGCNSSTTSKSSNTTGRSVTGECSSSSSENGETCTGEDEYYRCLQQACSTQYQACLGPNYLSGSYSGSCKTEMECVMACSCDDFNCELTCYKNASQACSDCLDAVDSCEQKSGCTEPVCGSSGSGGAASSGVGGATAQGGGASTNPATGGANVGQGGAVATTTLTVTVGGGDNSGVGGATAVAICPYTAPSLDCATACTNLKAIAAQCQTDPSLSADTQAILAAAATGSGTACKASCASLSPSSPAQWKCYQAVPTTADCTAIAGCTAYNCPPP